MRSSVQVICDGGAEFGWVIGLLGLINFEPHLCAT